MGNQTIVLVISLCSLTRNSDASNQILIFSVTQPVAVASGTGDLPDALPSAQSVQLPPLSFISQPVVSSSCTAGIAEAVIDVVDAELPVEGPSVVKSGAMTVSPELECFSVTQCQQPPSDESHESETDPPSRKKDWIVGAFPSVFFPSEFVVFTVGEICVFML